MTPTAISRWCRPIAPFLHTWSLGVEEQFYVVWPVLRAIASRTGWLGPSIRARVLRAIVLVIAGSFVLSLALTLRGTPWAFYSLPTRAWELGLGGSLVFLERGLRLSDLVRRSLEAAGVAGLCAAALVLAGLVPYPGGAALLPVLGTAALILAGSDATRSSSVSGVLRWGPVQALGRVSYAWYLWHWPAFALVDAYRLADPAPPSARCVVVVAALGVAFLSHHAVENPIRFSARQAPRPSSAAVAGVSLVAVAVAGTATLVVATRATSDPHLKRLAAAADPLQLVACKDTVDGSCTFGDRRGEKTLLLYGDSHAAQWLPALDRVAASMGVRLVAATRGGCPPFPLLVARTGTRRPSELCLAHRARVLRQVAGDPPDAVLLVSAAYAERVLTASGRPAEPTGVPAVWERSFREGVSFFAERGARVGVILDNPGRMGNPIECLARAGTLHGCAVPRERALSTLEPLRSVKLEAMALGSSMSSTTQGRPWRRARMPRRGG